MKILVSVKRVADPDNANKVKLSGDKKQVTTQGLEWKPNPFDEYALEAALRLNENGGTKERFGEIVAVSIGPKDAGQTLRQALALGADRAILVDGKDEELDASVVADVLAAVTKREKPDVVLMGKQAADGDSNAVGQMLAEKLGWPMATFAMRIATSDGGKTLTIGREVDTGVLSVRITPPVVLTASDRILSPTSVKNGVTPADFKYPESDGARNASLKGIMGAKKKPIEELTMASLGVTSKQKTQYVGFDVPPPRSGRTVVVQSVQELVQKLRTEAKVL